MADRFDEFLACSLAPPEGSPDRAFVAAVQVRIELEDRLERQRRELVRTVGTQLVALGAVAAGLWWLTQAAPIAGWLREDQGASLAVLLAVFVVLVALFTRRPANAIRILRT